MNSLGIGGGKYDREEHAPHASSLLGRLTKGARTAAGRWSAATHCLGTLLGHFAQGALGKLLEHLMMEAMP